MGKKWLSLAIIHGVLSGSLLVSACGPKTVRIGRVSEDDALRANALGSEADRLFQRKEYYPALIKYLEASRINPGSVYLLNALGLTYSQLGYTEKAIAAFKRAIVVDSKYAFPFNNLGSAYFATNQKEKAERYFKKAIALRPGAAVFHLNLANLYFETKKAKQGIEECRRALALDPQILSRVDQTSLITKVPGNSSPERHCFMARLYAKLGDASRAMEFLELALRSGVSDFTAILHERDFDPIRQDQRFQALLQTVNQLQK